MNEQLRKEGLRGDEKRSKQSIVEEKQAEYCTPIDKEVHEVEDLLRGPSELGHPSLDPDELNLQAER